MNLKLKAQQFAIKAHKDQKYGTLPYTYHLQQVASRIELWRDRGALSCFSAITDEHIAVAWLHDVLEDTDTPYSDLVIEFGKVVADAVFILTKSGSDYAFYIQCIKDLEMARIIKLADTLCNLEASLYSGELKRINKYTKQLNLLTEGF